MKPWRTLDRARAPGGGELVLQERDGQFTIRVDGKELMSSRKHASEEAMAAVAFEGREPPARARVLVGGLGLGYTLRATLDRLPPGGEVVVAEVSGAVVAWNKGPLAPLAGHPLDDPRTRVDEVNLLALLKSRPPPFDAILIDLDNGPAALSLPGNRELYADRGVELCRGALTADGTLVVWSAGPDAAYLARLRRGGFDAVERAVRAHGSAATRHTLFVARRRR